MEIKNIVSDLEDFSSDFERLRRVIMFLNDFVWDKITSGDSSDNMEQIGSLTETLLEVAQLRDKRIVEIIAQIRTAVSAMQDAAER